MVERITRPAPDESEKRLKDARENVRKELAELRQQVTKGTVAPEQRKKAVDAAVSLQALNKEAYGKLVTSLRLTLTAASTPEVLVQTLEKDTKSMEAALSTLAAEVGGTYPYAAEIDRNADRLIVGVNRAVESAYRGGLGKYLREQWGMDVEDAKNLVMTVLPWVLRYMKEGSSVQTKQALEQMALSFEEEGEFRAAFAAYRGDKEALDLPEVRRGFRTLYRTWRTSEDLRVTNPAAPNPGPKPTIQDVLDHREIADGPAAVKAAADKKAAAEAETEKAKKEAEDFAKREGESRIVDGTEYRPDGNDITSTTLNVNGRTVSLERRDAGYGIRFGETWIPVRRGPPDTAPTSLRLWAPVGATSNADLRVILNRPGPRTGTRAFATSTVNVSLGEILNRIPESTALPSAIRINNDNTLVTTDLAPEAAALKFLTEMGLKVSTKEEFEKLVETATTSGFDGLSKLVGYVKKAEEERKKKLGS